MWESFEARLDENDPRYASQRRTYLELIRGAGLRPGDGQAKKMLPFKFGGGELLLWGIEGSARSFFLHPKWERDLKGESIDCEIKRFDPNKGAGGGRHTGLNSGWAFGKDPCLAVPIESEDALLQLIVLLTQSGEALMLDTAAITRWIERLRHFFPALDRFDRPDPHFDEAERTYKLEIAAKLKAEITKRGSDQDLADAVNTALAKSNLLQWRAYWPMSPKGDADREKLWPALREFVDAALGAADGHALALEAFVNAWVAAVPNGKPDPARQIGEFLLLHLAPDEGIYIRHSVRQDLWLEAVGSRFPEHASMAHTYRDEWRFMEAVRSAFLAQGLAPRDMIDVQSALWIIHSYKDEDLATFSREAIEAAMDAYDNYRVSGDHAAIFDAFGEPRDYWVRSTRERPNRVYPSKPIVGFMRNTTQLNGGWGQKNDAAAQLHNAGYIVVGEGGKPADLPEQRSHLINGRSRVQLCAANYYIAPAKEAGVSVVSVRAGDLRAVLAERTQTICAALNDENLQRLADVSKPQMSGPAKSRDSVFSFYLGEKGERPAMNSVTSVNSVATTNLILYGPPGTGKTYRTAWEAVRLCLGDAEAERFGGDEKRAALMAEYRRLMEDERRIEFVTFHQSMSYEEFVEGLRPTTGRSQDPEAPQEEEFSAGFRLEPQDGIFMRISERAADDRGEAGVGGLDRTRRIYRLGLTGGDWRADLQKAVEEEEISWGYGGDTDWSAPEYEDWEVIKQRRKADDASVKGNHATVYGTWLVRSGAPDGDYVILTVGRNRAVAFGRLAGDYRFTPAHEDHSARHTRTVEWMWNDPAGIDRSVFYETPFTSYHPIYPLERNLIDWPALESIVLGKEAKPANPRPHVLIIDEVNRANISKVFGELITLLEPDKRLGKENEIRLTLPYSKKRFGVPPNLHIIATMNTADRSIALLDTALRRRFTFRELMPEPRVLPADLDGINLQKLLRTINERIEYLFDREHQIGHAYFTGCASRAMIAEVMRYKVIPLLAEYFYEDWSKVAAVLGDAAQDNPRFLVREVITSPSGLATDTFSGSRYRWRVRPDVQGDKNGGLDFTEFEV